MYSISKKGIYLSIGKIKPLTRAHPPAPPRTSPVSPLEISPAAPARQRLASSVDRQAGRAPSAPRATQSGEGAGRGQGEKVCSILGDVVVRGWSRTFVLGQIRRPIFVTLHCAAQAHKKPALLDSNGLPSAEWSVFFDGIDSLH
jgi:hypothetical protein